MPRHHLWIREETRLLGAIQIMIGLNIHGVGLLWTYLFLSQTSAFGKSYLPLSTVTGYPYWSSACFIFSGVLAVIVEKRRSIFLLSYTITVNILSACISVIGLLLLSLEFMIYSVSTHAPIWPERSGKILSEYLFLFTFLELFLTCTVVHWGYKAKYHR
ncbi:membrane-spanning 4-domains subfamily A member 15-like [Zalophus californianus]|uniref:Membrane-spanning 4-domains subfamily A member 15-like n=2 Tax=Otariidae TaxID=9702 RepID=A0A3Q7R2X2_CALUR|nr:membrane-spanning 4-domains subfamily A member 15-like [Callorhinus ursinus]XP_027436490.1 membrane-spanning 4-domains subfamily A member 15-like [Zalophus californianus]XP_027436491.1 membrane-spanning 4-domains subfamily A member 15-like [Zalophus californianus]